MYNKQTNKQALPTKWHSSRSPCGLKITTTALHSRKSQTNVKFSCTTVTEMFPLKQMGELLP